MSKLSEDQIAFLLKRGISPSEVFDANGLKPRHFQPLMEEGGFRFLVGSSVCLNGHYLRSKSNHCIQCNPARIRFSTRHSETAHVYVACSLSKSLVKIGMTGNLDDRLWKIRDYQYGGASDWSFKRHWLIENAGRVEFEAQAQLTNSRATGSYVQGGRLHSCYELFRCDPDEAVRAVEGAIQSSAPH